ncbi:MAG TPA: helix-turn-helix domain-containing protein [Rugosimonospora sp.]|nr:helix-turn-helix domain-containing protein [Rugosimonospora sp.]
MGHREDLLAGARRCLLEKGYAQTTARDIVAASGTNLASIGYHYGSKDALMTAALFQVLEEAAAQLRQALDGDEPGEEVRAGEPDGPGERFAAAWARLLESFAARREVWAATFDVLAQADRVPPLRQAVSEGLQDGRTAWATLLSTVEEAAGDGAEPAEPGPVGRHAQAVGALCQALVSGVMVQWLVDPQRAPSGEDLVDALRAIAAALS